MGLGVIEDAGLYFPKDLDILWHVLRQYELISYVKLQFGSRDFEVWGGISSKAAVNVRDVVVGILTVFITCADLLSSLPIQPLWYV